MLPKVQHKSSIDGESKSQIGAGQYEFPFEFKLPDEEMPWAFDGNKGYVAYTVEGLIHRSIWKNDYRAYAFLPYVSGHEVDLNHQSIELEVNPIHYTFITLQTD